MRSAGTPALSQRSRASSSSSNMVARKPLLRQAQLFGNELQREGYGILLEIVTDAEVAQHLEQGQVGGVADLVDIDRSEGLLGSRQPPVWGGVSPVK